MDPRPVPDEPYPLSWSFEREVPGRSVCPGSALHVEGRGRSRHALRLPGEDCLELGVISQIRQPVRVQIGTVAFEWRGAARRKVEAHVE